MPGFSVLHHLTEFAQTHVHWVDDTIQPSHPLPPFPPALILPHPLQKTRNKCWKEYGEKGIFVHYWWEYKSVQLLGKTIWRFLKKLKIGMLHESAILLLGSFLKEMKSLSWKDNLHFYIHCSIIYNSQGIEIKYPSVDEWIKKMWYSCILNGILFSHKKERNPAVCDNMDGPWRHCADLNKADRERQIPFDLNYVQNLKYSQIPPLWGYKTRGIRDGQNRWRWSKSTNFQLWDK